MLTQPKLLHCDLKNYQLKGLSWLNNLYEQGINGILADEMGLGKTVQSISLLAHIAETQGIWGPFLVVAPVSTLHNWQQELTKFTPDFKVVPYWGSQKDRKVLRKFWNAKHLYGRDAAFHVLITSYQLVVSDEKYFNRIRWQYMILDEAQALKSSQSQRWNILLKFNCRNRLLLTGTPIQNSMQELWALLHFIMPTLFDSHEEFGEWFSKDIESHVTGEGEKLDQHQLSRLHMILKPFMLRRVKKDVENELGEKIEIDVPCVMSARQRRMYQGVRAKISVSELLQKSSLMSDENVKHLMNLVMQFRKVCNHPELFERKEAEEPMRLLPMSRYIPSALRTDDAAIRPLPDAPVGFDLPKLVYREMLAVGERDARNVADLWDVENVPAVLRLCDMSPAEAASIATAASLLEKWAIYLATEAKTQARARYSAESDGEYDRPHARLCVVPTWQDARHNATFERTGALAELCRVGARAFDEERCFAERFLSFVRPAAIASLPQVRCHDRAAANDMLRASLDPLASVLRDGRIELTARKAVNDSNDDASGAVSEGAAVRSVPLDARGEWLVEGADVVSNGGFESNLFPRGLSFVAVPDPEDLINDSGKLFTLDRLLPKLMNEGHRVLIYCQMTRIIDILEDYMRYRNYRYLRLDGSSKIEDRRDMVNDFQNRNDIFVFLLSTRAGGVGINLTAADTVVFFESDWNPTVDQQAMDRVHRLGQKKQVTIYRLITKGSIEERIVMRAKQKNEIQKVVIQGGQFRMEDFRSGREIVSLLLDDKELEEKMVKRSEQAAADKRKGEESKDEVPVAKKKRQRAVNGEAKTKETAAASPKGKRKKQQAEAEEASSPISVGTPGSVVDVEGSAPPTPKRIRILPFT